MNFSRRVAPEGMPSPKGTPLEGKSRREKTFSEF
jgi:hypothetical protein